MLISSKLIIWHLSKKIFRIKIAGKGAAVEKYRTVIGGKRINERASFGYNVEAVHKFFLSAEGGFRSFDKGDCRAHFSSYLSIFDFWALAHILGVVQLLSLPGVPPWPNPFKNEAKWQVGGLPPTTALCAVLRELFFIRFRLSFYFYWRECCERDKFKLDSTCMKSFT